MGKKLIPDPDPGDKKTRVVDPDWIRIQGQENEEIQWKMHFLVLF
jgi:hypothetical protein